MEYFGYYIFGFCLGMAVGQSSGKDSMRGQINRLNNDSRQKSYQIQNYKKFIESNSLEFEYSQFIEKKTNKDFNSIDLDINVKIDDFDKKQFKIL